MNKTTAIAKRGKAKLASTSERKKEVERRSSDSQEQIVNRVASGITYYFRWYQNWMEAYFNNHPVHRSSKWTGYGVYEEMDCDAHIYNVFSIRNDQLLAHPFYVRSADRKSDLENFKMAFAYWNMDRIDELEEKKRDQLRSTANGFSVAELEFAVQDVVIPDRQVKKWNGDEKTIKGGTMHNAVVVKDIIVKPISAFGFDRHGNLSMVPVTETDKKYDGRRGYDNSHYGEPRLLDPEESEHFMVMSHDVRNRNRYGWPVKASIFWDWIMKKAAKIYRMIFVEKYGMPWAEGEYESTDTAEITRFEQTLAGLQKNSWFSHPKGFAVKFVEALNKSGSIDVYQNLLDFCDGNISEAVLGHREAVKSSSGAYASAEAKEVPLRQDKLAMDAKRIDSVYNDQFIRRLIDFNFVPNGRYPYVQTDVKPESDLNKKIFRYATAYNMKVPISLAQFYEDLALNEPEDMSDVLLMGDTGADPNTLDEKAEDTVGGENMPNQNPDGTKSKMGKLLTRPFSSGITINLNVGNNGKWQ